jgi:glycogen(starch) synthase
MLVLTPGDLVADPRARRAANVAVSHDFGVVSLAISSAPSTGHAEVAPGGIEAIRIPGDRLTSALRRAGLGGMKEGPRVVRELRGAYRLLRMARDTVALVRAGRPIRRADVVHAHDLATLPAGFRLAKRLRARLVYDAHEIYAAQEPNPPWLYATVTSWLEARLARRAQVITVSAPIAADLERTLRLPASPLVVLSCSERLERIPPRARERSEARMSAIYQGAMGPGRPIEDLFIAAAAMGDNVVLSARITGIDLNGLRAKSAIRGLAGRFLIRDPVAPDSLVQALIEFDVGLIINRPVTKNDELVLPNKLFEYMMAGLAVVAPRLPGLVSLIEEEGVGATYRPADPLDLARVLDELAADRPRLEAMKHRARQLALERYNAEAQKPVLLEAWGL